MFSSALDESCGVVVWLFTGRANSDDDWARYVDELRAAAAVRVENEQPVAVMIADEGNPAPNAKWRKRIADEAARIQPKSLVAFVTASALIRGAAVAIRWLTSTPYELETFATLDEAVAWIERRRARPMPIVRALERRARSAAERKRNERGA